jgi:hypothetical protein
MAPIDGRRYLIVLDTKAHKKGRRTGVLEVRLGEPNRFKSLEVDALDKGDDRASDLEALHVLPGRPGEYLAAESGRRLAGPGRVFHLAYDDDENELAVLASWPLPYRVAAPEAWELGRGDNYEGLACMALGEDRFQLLLGERGGSKSHPRGALISGSLDLGAGTLTWLPPERDLTLAAPGPWITPEQQRDIADLWFDDRDNSVWCVGSEDPGDSGPFRSVIWRAARASKADPETRWRDVVLERDPVAPYDHSRGLPQLGRRGRGLRRHVEAALSTGPVRNFDAPGSASSCAF